MLIFFCFGHSNLEHSNLFRISRFDIRILNHKYFQVPRSRLSLWPPALREETHLGCMATSTYYYIHTQLCQLNATAHFP